ncbi:putative lipoprotein precursor LplA [Beutenbergia cavernae DSM 12333]|uniref:Putative lipoprotein LplA n=1 Tax=Beutenbergia cavernae (strain ATCC BAA-8 / DSM 12333 / CCUG 43141 / JCM 11478 / NBRC 16432 / NCIMB 13614 / HKI 0122) TaxID=471853 RepID=C5C3D6_BEUC1|nr:sugar ABC transporter substrate-binding protein [Beutenbergia cavernae]ACQ79835.1 putative lipoprotein precursor LplA [Beutenbergia cavernae DSM 12333]
MPTTFSSLSASGVSRRSFLTVTGTAAGLGALTACSGSGGSSGGASESANLTLPTYRESTGAAPDLPGTAEGVQPGYLTFPESFEATTAAKPLTGTASGLTETFATPPPAMDQNPFWQRLNSALGGDLDLIIGTDPGYPEKFATILASDDLPDMMWVPPNQGIPNVGQMLEAKFTDLTDYLSGDAVLEYPNLAALKPSSWQTAVVNGKIWGAPIPSTPFGQVMCGNPDVWERVGGFTFTDIEDLFDKATEISDGNTFAFEPAVRNVLNIISQCYGAPNTWRVNSDRTLTRNWETEEYKAAIEFVARCWAAGLIYEDLNLANPQPLAAQGRIASFVSVGPQGVGQLRDYDPGLPAVPLVPFAATSDSRPSYNMGYGTVGFTPFKQADEGKIRELLALVNWLSAPFGSAEYVQKQFGTEGEDWTRDSAGDLQPTPAAETNVPGLVSALNIMTSGETVLYSPGFPEDTEAAHALQGELIKLAMYSPVRGLYSDTNTKDGATISVPVNDTIVDVITGRATIADFEAAVTRFNEEGGEKIREEFEAVLPDDVPVTPTA